KSDADPPSRRDSPAVGSALARLRPTGLALPPFVTMPWIVSHPAAPGGKAPGQNAGWLGPAYDPFVLTADPAAPEFAVPQLAPPRPPARGAAGRGGGPRAPPGGRGDRARGLLRFPAPGPGLVDLGRRPTGLRPVPRAGSPARSLRPTHPRPVPAAGPAA